MSKSILKDKSFDNAKKCNHYYQAKKLVTRNS